MSEIIYWVLVLKIHDGQTAAFKALSAELIASSQNEPGTLNYEWSLSEDGTSSHIYERYVNSAAIKAHIANNGDQVGRLFAMASPISMVIYGSPDDEVRRDLAGLNPVYMVPLGGFGR